VDPAFVDKLLAESEATGLDPGALGSAYGLQMSWCATNVEGSLM
jgi:hypothetical protein